MQDLDEKKYLTDKEMMKFELYHEQERNRKSQIALLKCEMKCLNLQLELKRKEVELLHNKQSLLEVRHDRERLNHRDWYDELLEKYDLESGFGFDPESGEIKEKDE